MEEKQINKWLRRRFTAVGWALVVYYVIMSILTAVEMAVNMLIQYLRAFAAGDFMAEPDMTALSSSAWGFILTIAVGLVVLYAWKGPDYWKSEILVKENPMTVGSFFCLLSLCIGSQMLNSLWVSLLELILNQFDMSVMTVLETVSGSSDTFSMFLYASILAPISEEILFRGYILRTLRPFGKRFAIFGSAFLFGLFHGNLLQTPYAFLVGLVLGYTAVEHNILWAIALHMFNNLVLADLLTRLTANLSEMALGVLNVVIFGGFLVAAIAILTARRREICAYNRSEWMDRRVLKCFFTNSGVIVLMIIMIINMIMILFV